jgi:hypothetical protein
MYISLQKPLWEEGALSLMYGKLQTQVTVAISQTATLRLAVLLQDAGNRDMYAKVNCC